MDSELYKRLIGPGTSAGELFERTQRLAGPMGEAAMRLQIRAEEAEIRANTDQLTGLKNRHAMEKELESIIANPGDNPERYILMFMDLNNFKDVNDVYGHAAGDSVLRQVGKRLELRKTDIVGRLGGDEFLIIVDTENTVPDRQDNETADSNQRRSIDTRQDIIDGLTNHVRDQVLVASQEVRDQYKNENVEFPEVSASVGVVELNGYKTPEEVIRAADLKMYQDKNEHKSSAKNFPELE